MDRYLTIEISEGGLYFSTAQVDFWLSWLFMSLVIVGFLARKVWKRKRKPKTLEVSEMKEVIDLWA